MITPANYDNCQASAVGFDLRGVGEMARRRARTPELCAALIQAPRKP
jgi:hypothetical protein